jgi:hypothetical protein
MPKKYITLTGLVPGKRYRMVVETEDGSNLTAPSIEFVVPSSPRLLSTYTPTFSVVKAYHDIIIPVDPPLVIGGGGLIPGTGTKTENFDVKLSRFVNTNGTRNYTITSTGAVPPKDQTFTVSGVSSGSAPYYFNWLVYTVTSTGKNPFTATAVGQQVYLDTLAPNGWRVKSSTSKADRALVTDGTGPPGVLWSVRNGVGWGDVKTNSNMRMYWTIDGIPAKYYDDDPEPYDKTVPNGGVHYHVDLTVPIEVQGQLAWTDTVKDVPVFFYINNNTFYDFNDKAFSDPLNSIVNSSNMTPLSLSTSNLNQIYTDGAGNRVMTKRNLEVNRYPNTTGTFSTTRSYRFSVVRYTRPPGGSTWTGSWLQTELAFDSTPTPDKIIYSQAGIGR